MRLRSVGQPAPAHPVRRVLVMRSVLLLVGFLFIGRLFYIQIIRHEYYQQKAASEHTSQFTIAAERGGVEVHSGEQTLPIVLNETKYTLYADPQLVKNVEKTAARLAPVAHLPVAELQNKMRARNRYSVLGRRLDKKLANRILKLDLPGIGLQAQSYRTYPQGNLAAQLLGFVNDDGEGQYGVEGYLNHILAGTPGTLKAITDNSKQHVPLATSDNVLVQPKPGKTVILSVDMGIQKLSEDALKIGVETSKAKSGSVLVMDPGSGAIKAMANYPTYEPAKFSEIRDLSVLSNGVVSSPLEVGSIMKTLTVATALNEGVIQQNSTYADQGQLQVDGKTIKNAINYGAAQRSISEILEKSLNTGAVHLLTLLGGGEINTRARQTLYNYDTQHYHLGEITGVEQSGEASGVIGSPTRGDGLNIRYANMAFGQGMTVTLLQMGAALSAVINGGTYYKPHLVEGYRATDGSKQILNPKILSKNVVKPSTSQAMVNLMNEYIAHNNRAAYREGYSVGGKTGTAQIPDGKGGYRDDVFTGTYLGFVGGAQVQYVIVVRVDEPHVPGFAGTVAAGPIFTNISNGLINEFAVKPR